MLGEIQALNAIAADLIGEGDHNEAVEILNLAITKISGSMLAPTHDALGCTPRRQHPKDMDDAHGVHVYFWEMVDPWATFLHQPCMFECNLASQLEDSFLTNEQFCFCAIANLFNMGLCYHKEWKRQTGTERGTHLLSISLYYYEQAYSMTGHCQLHASDSILQVIMAVCANAFHCNSELPNIDFGGINHHRMLLVSPFMFFLSPAFPFDQFLYNLPFFVDLIFYLICHNTTK
ncbi:hypothetical protein ACA910_006741 [Epithemia clementina (nom. ined.)]